MAKQFMIKAMGIVALTSVGAATWAAGDGPYNVKYKGEESARAVCMSIVYDDVDGLKDAFRLGRTHPLERSHLMYECNRLELDEFAFTQNADSVSEYLAPKFGREGVVTIQQVGSVGD